MGQLWGFPPAVRSWLPDPGHFPGHLRLPLPHYAPSSHLLLAACSVHTRWISNPFPFACQSHCSFQKGSETHTSHGATAPASCIEPAWGRPARGISFSLCRHTQALAFKCTTILPRWSLRCVRRGLRQGKFLSFRTKPFHAGQLQGSTRHSSQQGAAAFPHPRPQSAPSTGADKSTACAGDGLSR